MNRLIEAYRGLSDTELFADASGKRMKAEAEMNAAHVEAGRHAAECVFCRAIANRRAVAMFPSRESGFEAKIAS